MVHRHREQLVLLTESSVAVALSVLLGNMRLVELPNGGSIALATLPLLALARARGVRTGVLAGCCAGVAHALSGGTIIHPAQLGLDYLLAYAALGLAGIARSRRGLVASLAIVVAMAMHLLAMVISGVVFFSAVAGDAALTYAIAYNVATVGPETVLALWLVPPLLRAIARANPADAWRRGLLDPPPARLRRPRTWQPPLPRPLARRSPPPVHAAVPHRDRPPAPARPAARARVVAPTAFVRPAPFAPRRSIG
jgi:thiamine transporter